MRASQALSPLTSLSADRYILALDDANQRKLVADTGESRETLQAIDRSPHLAALFLEASGRDGNALLRASALTSRLQRTALIAQVDISRAHPVNVARSLLSLSHLSGHKAGWSIKPIADDALRKANPWIRGGAKANGKYSIRQEFALLVSELTRSWPYESVIGDRSRGWFHIDGAIRTVRHRGHFDVDGVLNVPSAPHGAVPFVTTAKDSELAGHLRIGNQIVNTQADSGRDIRISEVSAPSNDTVGWSASAQPLYFVEGVRTIADLSALKRTAELASSDNRLEPEAATIWELLNVRPSVAPVVVD